MKTFKDLYEQHFRPVVESAIHNHPEVEDMRSKGYSVYASRPSVEDPHVVHEIEKNGRHLVVVRGPDEKYRIRTGKFGSLSKTSYDTLHDATKSGMTVANTGKYKNLDFYG